MKTNPSTVKTRQELAQEYQVSVSTLKRWLQKRNIILPPGLLYPTEVQKIYTVLGKPLAKTRVELAEEYGISQRTLRRKMKALNIQIPAGRIVPKDINRIYKALGVPPFKRNERKQ